MVEAIGDIKQITLPASSGTSAGTYNIVDQGARTAIDNLAKLPAVTSTDNGKFLRVVNGAWNTAVVSNAEDNTF